MSAPTYNLFQSQMCYPTRIRSAKACDHCRTKRIKCSGYSAETNNSCLACISYNKPCVFSQTPDPRSRRGKRKDAASHSQDDEDALGAQSQYRSKKIHGRSSSSASNSESRHGLSKSPSMSSTASAAEFQHRTPESSFSTRTPQPLPEFQPTSEQNMNFKSSFDSTPAGKKFFGLYVPMMMGAPEYNVREGNPQETIHDPKILSVLATHNLFDAMIKAYFECIDPMCPLFEKPENISAEVTYFLTELQSDAANKSQLQEPHAFLRAKLILCLGAIVVQDKLKQAESDFLQLIAIDRFREALFDQITEYCCTVVLKQCILSLQIMLLVSLYSKHLQQLDKALYWCRLGIRMAQLFRLRNRDGSLELKLVIYCLFILESQICLLENHDDPRYREGDIPVPDRAIQLRYPVFCMRISLARMINRYTVFLRELVQGDQHVATNLATLCCDLVAFKDYMPMEFQVDQTASRTSSLDLKGSLLSGSTGFQLEYYGAVIIIMSTLTGLQNVLKSATFKLRNHATIQVSAARKLIHYMTLLENSLAYASYWIDPKQVLKSFVIMYSFHHFHSVNLDFSETTDTQLIQASIRLFEKTMLPTRRNRLIKSLMEELTTSTEVASPAVTPSTADGLTVKVNSHDGELSTYFQGSALATSQPDILGAFEFPFPRTDV